MTIKRAVWFVRRGSDNRILGVDGKWYDWCGYIERIKFYTSSGRALKYGLRGRIDGTAFAVYNNDSIDCNGCINGKATYA